MTLTARDPRWDLPETVTAIASGDDWAVQVDRFWVLVSRSAHKEAHPHGVFGCPGCEQTRPCPSCGKPFEACPDPAGHDRLVREGESGLLIGSALYGGGR